MEKIIRDFINCFEVEKEDIEILVGITQILHRNDQVYCHDILSLICGYESGEVLEQVDYKDEILAELEIDQDYNFVPLCKYISLVSFEDEFEYFKEEFDDMFKQRNIIVDLSSLELIFTESHDIILNKLNELLNTVGYSLAVFSPIEQEVIQFTIIKNEFKKQFDDCMEAIFGRCDLIMDCYKLF